MENILVFIIGVVALVCGTAIILSLDETSYKKIMARRIRNLRKENRELKKKNKKLKEDARWPEFFVTAPFRLSCDKIECLENEIKALERQRDYYRDLFTYNRDTTSGLWCIDRDPKEVTKEWIEENAFQINTNS